MEHAIERAIDLTGGCSKLAALLGISPPSVHEWGKGRRPVPIERCVEIERLTQGAVRRWDLRPHDWWRIWPELVDAEGAPAVRSNEPCARSGRG